MSNYTELKISQISIGENNPRKTFETESLNELAESISKNGVIQPILVRPIEEEQYELVCGERRFRASKIANKDTIPAMIKELTDEEAFELQIIENLERKDVHPIEEANAFKKLLESGNYNTSDIALKFAKSESFIAQRLKLTDLIEEIQDDFRSDLLSISQANLISRLSEDDQNKILENYCNHSGVDGYGTTKELDKYINSELVYKLDDAIFNLSQIDLIPDTSSCVNCLLRSGANPTLFIDVEEPNICFKPSCFDAKNEQHIFNSVNDLITERPNIIFVVGFKENKVNEQLQELLTENDIEPLVLWTDYNLSESGIDNAIEAYNIVKGEFCFITLKNQDNTISENDIEKSNPFQDQIDTLEKRAARALELDREKIYKRVINEIVDESDNSDKIYSKEELSELEKKALLFDIITSDDIPVIELYSNLKFEDEYLPYGVERINIIKDAFCEEFYNVILRRHIKRSLYSMNDLDYQTSAKPLLMINIAKIHFNDQINLIIEEQQYSANKRTEKTNKKIEELKAQLNNANS
ncbi:ParB/RepB/Spo0J family partition protein [Empedobacter falsenii]|uniref:ParB/RepB/Spo0J family partition protein n=1 Tax=Empedobacter falsenii TaxID=343874 RepID=UPI003A80026E